MPLCVLPPRGGKKEAGGTWYGQGDELPGCMCMKQASTVPVVLAETHTEQAQRISCDLKVSDSII